MSAEPIYPKPLAAALLCVSAWLMTALVTVTIGGSESGELPVAALGIGEAVGIGGMAFLASLRVPEPQPARIGMRGLELAWLPALLALLPILVLSSELGNSLDAVFPAPEAGELQRTLRDHLHQQNALGVLEMALVVAGIAPIVEEWLYRGVIQQGVVARLGKLPGVALAAFYFSLAHLNPVASPAHVVVTLASTWPLGAALGLLRLATGSLAAPILLHALYNALALLAWRFDEVVPIAGFNAEGAHTPLALLLASVASVAFAISRLWPAARRAAADPGLPSEESGAGIA
jgi:membrane protease YdiL (CAAX protease family)